MKKVVFILISVIILLTVAYKYNNTVRGFANNLRNRLEGKTLSYMMDKKVKSGNLSTDYNVEDALEDIRKFDLNTVNIPVVINIDSLSSSDMTVDKASEEKAISLIKKLSGRKISIILEAYPWIRNGSLYETEWKPENMKKFFNNWRVNVLKTLIDDIANPYGVEVLNTGSNYVRMEGEEEEWCNTIDYVRKYYKGLVTYRTGWWYTKEGFEAKLKNKLFSKVDFISVSAYFELTEKETNTVEELVNSISSTSRYNRKQNIKEELKEFHDRWNKPIFFGELGFPKKNGAAIEPWNPDKNAPKNEKEQANCFEAYRRVFENEPWLLGFSIFAVGEHGADKNYYPGEEAAQVLRKWYSK